MRETMKKMMNNSMKKIAQVIAGLLIICTLNFSSRASEPSINLPIVNNTAANITAAEIELAYQATLARFRKVMPPELLARIDREKIKRIAIVNHTSHPDVSDAGLTAAEVDEESGEVESIEIEVQPDYRVKGKPVAFRTIMEHEFAHAFAFLAGLPQAQQVGHTVEIEQLRFPASTPQN